MFSGIADAEGLNIADVVNQQLAAAQRKPNKD